MARRTTKEMKAEAIHRRAHQQWDSGRLRSAFRLMLGAAKLGDRSAMHNLGYLYDCGIGVRADRDKAMFWYRRAFRSGVVVAATNIGTIYRDERQEKRAREWFEKGVQLGDIEANFEIARMLLNDEMSAASAIPYLKKVARARPRVDVTQASWEEARRILKKLSKERLTRH